MSQPPAAAPEPQTIPIRGMRRAIGRTMAQAWREAPHVTLTREVDLTDAQQSLAAADTAAGGPSLFDLIIVATARTLRDFPLLNANVGEREIMLHPEVDIGLAVAIEGGILVPVLEAADRLEVAELSARRRLLQQQALQTGKLDSFTEPTFTISNLGLAGIDFFAPIIAPGQTGALGIGAIARRPFVVGDDLEIRTTAYLTLSFDHRALDGDPAARFLATVASRIGAL
jgi:pyruvate dehydrogenase E2 component (dihydrolipoamide acetyltransferase)